MAGMAWAGAVYKAGHVRRRPSDLGLRWFCGTLFVLALALTLLWDPAYEALDRVVAYPNFAIVAGDGLALAACCGALCYFAHLSYPAPRARQLTGVFVLVLVLTLGVMAFFFSRIPMTEDTSRFWEVYAHRPGVAAFRLTFLAYLALSCVGLLLLATSYARLAVRRSTVAGMQMVKWGGFAGIVFTANEAARVLDSSRSPVVSPTVVGIACVGLIMVGVLLPSVGPRVRLEQALDWIANYRALRRVTALWRAMTQARPQVAFQAGAGPLTSRLYRRVVEIEDAVVRMQAPKELLTSLAREAESVAAEKERAAFMAARGLALALRYPDAGDASVTLPSHRADLNEEAQSVMQVARWWTSRQLRGALARITGVVPGHAYRLAKLISELVAPMPVIGVLAIVIALHSSPSLRDGLRWAAIAVFFVAVLPFGYITLRTRRGALTDHHIRRRSQRTGPILVTGVSIGAGLALMLLGGAPRQLVALIVVGLAGLLVTGVITQFWKISLHTSTLSGAVTCAVLVFGALALPLFLLPLAVAWARLELGEHTLAQVGIGVLTGTEVAAVVFPSIA